MHIGPPSPSQRPLANICQYLPIFALSHVPGELTRPPTGSPGTWEGSLDQSPASRHTLRSRWHSPLPQAHPPLPPALPTSHRHTLPSCREFRSPLGCRSILSVRSVPTNRMAGSNCTDQSQPSLGKLQMERGRRPPKSLAILKNRLTLKY
jgi:hypothetical protein